MNLNELIEELKIWQSKGFGDWLISDFTLEPFNNIRKGMNVDYNTGDETNLIIIE